MDKALNSLLMDAAAKVLNKKAVTSIEKPGVKKADPQKFYADYDLSLGEFYIPGRTRRESATEEQKMIAGLKMLTEKLQSENIALRKQSAEDKVKVHQIGFDEGRKKGAAEGYEKGKNDLKEAISKVQGNLISVIRSFELKKNDVLNNSERKALEIIFLAVEKIIRLEAKTRKEVVLNILKSAISEVSKSDKLTIKINPSEIEAVNTAKDFWLPVNAQIKEVLIEEDSRVECGGCILESQSGSVDARINVQMEKIREIFLKCWEDGIGSFV